MNFYIKRHFLDRDIFKSAPIIYEPSALRIGILNSSLWVEGCHTFYETNSGFIHEQSCPSSSIAYKNLLINNHTYITPSGIHSLSRESQSFSTYEHNLVLSSTSDHLNYWHWMFDSLLKVVYLLNYYDLDPAQLHLYICSSNSLRTFHYESLLLLGINRLNIHLVPNQILLSSSYYVVLPSPISHHPPSINLLKDTLKSKSSNIVNSFDSHEKIFIQRGNAKNPRNISNINSIVDLAFFHDFKFVDPGTLSVCEQIACFSSANKILGVHGSAFLNMMFGTYMTVIELFTHDYCPLHEYALAHSCNHIYYPLKGDTANKINLNYLESII